MKENEKENKNIDMFTEITFRDKTYRMYFTLNVIQKLQDKYGSFDDWTDLVQPREKGKETNIGALIYGFTEMINEGIDIYNEEHADKMDFFTEKQMGRIITEIGIQTVNQKMNETVVKSSRTQSKN